jgi:DNA-binding transcriptional LysR family regulator
MELKQVEYILKIAEENNITHAAEKLFITQSALNQQLLKLEKELGTPLFHRNRNNWSLTEAGEVYVKNARELLRIKKSTYDQIRDISNIQKGTLSIGYTPARGIRMFGSVYPAFHSVFPDITVIPTEGRVRELQPMIANDSLDIAFLTLNRSDFTGDEYIKLLDEEIFLIIPQEHPLSRYAAPVGEPRATLDINLLRNEPGCSSRPRTIPPFCCRCAPISAAVWFRHTILETIRKGSPVLRFPPIPPGRCAHAIKKAAI